MSHDTHHGHSTENKTILPFKNAFWLVVIIAGLFVAALNFVQAESGGEGEHAAKEHSEHKEHAADKNEAGPHTVQEENKTQTKPEETPTPSPAADSTAKHAE